MTKSTTNYEMKDLFEYIRIDSKPPGDPWGKTIGDINGDGRTDLIVAGHRPNKPNIIRKLLNKLKLLKYEWPTNSELVWYENPNWTKHLVSMEYRFRTDLEVADIDGDGRSDIVALTDTGIHWFKNPEWSSKLIDNRILHDIEVVDFDNDGDIDIVARDQSGFNHNAGNKLYFYRQDSPSQWNHFEISIPHGEGLKVADMDSDKLPDVVVNKYWYKNPGALSKNNAWTSLSYTHTWNWQDVFIDVADMNMDGKPDVILAPSEIAGKKYHISWFEAPQSTGDKWYEHIVDPDVEAVHHSVHAGDFDMDGHVDILSAEMIEGENPDEVVIYWNNTESKKWEKQIISTKGSHSMRIMDIDGDGDLDFFGANWSGEDSTVDLWINKKKKPR